jgi:hypothetical protein
MRSAKARWAAFCAVAIVTAVSGCGSKSEPEMPGACTPAASSNGVTTSTISGIDSTATNVMKITVDGSLCGSDAYPNEPCASVQVCNPGGSCATIDHLLVDTGSNGLRIFKSVLTAKGIAPTPVAAADGGSLAECVGFGDGSSEWGQVGLVDLVMGNEPKISNIPIHVIDSTYAGAPTQCTSAGSTPDVDPSIGFNGIIGLGLFAEDCGSFCVTKKSSGMYYSCASGSCSQSVAALGKQVVNPVTWLTTDNNGIVVALPSVPDAGAASADGYIFFGIGTRSNNAPDAVQLYQADVDTMSTVFSPFSDTSIMSFIDSGSSLIFFPWPPFEDSSLYSLIPDCSDEHGSGMSGFYCPESTRTTAATNIGVNDTASSCVGFSVANAYTQLQSGSNKVFSNLTGSAGDDLGSVFDWGLPFFLGRKVYIGIENKSASGLGTGPFWAY